MASPPLMTVIAGTNGAGKSTVTSILLQYLYLGEVIDADAIAKELNPGSPEQANFSAGREVVRRVEKCIVAQRNFSIETTLAGGNAIRQMREAKKHCFEITLYYVGLPSVELHISRVVARVQAGGHHIDERVIRDRYGRSFDHLIQCLPLIDHMILVDNSVDPSVVLQIDSGRVTYESTNLPKWAVEVREHASALI